MSNKTELEQWLSDEKAAKKWGNIERRMAARGNFGIVPAPYPKNWPRPRPDAGGTKEGKAP